VHRVVEVDEQFGLEVATVLRPATRTALRAAPEQATEDVAESAAEALAVEVERGTTRTEEATTAGTAALAHHLAHLVVGLALLVVAEHVVRRAHFLEPFLGSGVAGVLVGMELAREVLVRLLDVLCRRAVGHTEHGVVVLFEPLPLRFQLG